MTQTRTTRTRRLVEDVLDLAAVGMHVFPLRPNDKRPAVDHREQRATTDPDRITRCWSHAPYGVGIACGPSCLVVVDLDTAKGDTPPAPGVETSEDVLAMLYAHHGDLYPFGMPTARTASGGTHLYFRAPDGREVRNSASKVGWKVDVRAAGGYVVAPPSAYRGSPYVWLKAPHEASPIPLPTWLAEAAAPRPAPARPVAMPAAVKNATGYVAAALHNEIQRVLDAQPGTRNDALVRASFSLARLAAGGQLPAAIAVEALYAAGQSVGLPYREVVATVTSGMRPGA
ncbi:bifunctional DNA primase/polymerase [Streptomyces sp. NRRL S-813]|uniref:bifunctional DNA primase/polymerase n=1 Tax=Streptomyces sp. NRRL S-813 TaxID=1463919 RepID=UPI000A733C07|nr:bifunctional DNA primase/polymerase [Streptomyces sp. NRRL S-813]